MPLIGRIGRKQWRARLALFTVYLVLSLGAITTVYPFLLMAVTGLKGATDQNEGKLVPAYFSELKREKAGAVEFDKESLFGKYIDDKYSGNVSAIESLNRPTDLPAEDVRKFLAELPPNLWHAGFRTAPNQVTSRLSRRYQDWLRTKFKSIDELNRTYIEENVAFQTATPPSEALDKRGWKPVPGRKYEDWLEFKKTLPVEFRIPLTLDRILQESLRAKYQAQFSAVPDLVKGKATKFEEISFAEVAKSSPQEIVELRKKLPDSMLSGKSVNELWGRDEPLSLRSFELAFVTQNQKSLRNEFASRNYSYVIDYVLLNGRAVLNTAIFCALMILAQLTVNPLAAYALSRYPIPATRKILIFLLATMAFPAEIAMIPSFLLLRDVGLLNTFGALVLPAAASGYMIFLLKGFFDSLPQELFEAGQIDGAKESMMMWKIALPLSRPVLGYLALLAFMGAYGSFLFAFLVNQDRSTWTLMVFLYQLQLSAPKATVMAALTLAALPTLIVFLFAQKVIMRGIVLPGER